MKRDEADPNALMSDAHQLLHALKKLPAGNSIHTCSTGFAKSVKQERTLQLQGSGFRQARNLEELIGRRTSLYGGAEGRVALSLRGSFIRGTLFVLQILATKITSQML